MARLPLSAALGGNPEATYALPGAVSKGCYPDRVFSLKVVNGWLPQDTVVLMG
ncbi:MAG: hypothetical protein ACI9J4_000459 [Paraglaciecola sp.]|jgi:hypothetical protein